MPTRTVKAKQTAPGDPVALRGQAVLGRYVDLLYAAGHPKTPLGSQQVYAILALNRSVAEVKDANERLTNMLEPLLEEQYWIDTSPSDFRLYWQQTLLIKLVLDPALVGRLSLTNQALIKRHLFNFIEGFSEEYTRNDFGSGDQAHAADIHGSDNHDIIRHGFFLLGSQILAADPNYATRRLPGDRTPAAIQVAFEQNTLTVLRERAATGLVAEIASPTYVGVYLQTLFIIADHADDAMLRRVAARFLDLTFADAAQETLGGVRGGARSRVYKSDAAYTARDDTFILPLFVLAGEPSAGPLWPLRPGYMPPRDAFAVLTTAYRLPPVVLEQFKDRVAMGTFQYDTRRPSTGEQTQATVRGEPYPVYHPDALPHFVRSSLVTPQYVLGWFTIDESRSALLVHDQNEEMGAITSVPDGRIAITGTPTNPDHRTSYHDLQAVGAAHAVLIRRNIHAQANLPLRLFFSPDFVISQTAEWLLAASRDQACWFGLRAVVLDNGILREAPLQASDWGKTIPGNPVAGHFYDFPGDAFLVVEAGSRDDGDFRTFSHALTSGTRLKSDARETGITYHLLRGRRNLTLFASARVPEINGRPLVLPPALTYSSPFLSSQPGSSAVVARSPGGDTLEINLA